MAPGHMPYIMPDGRTLAQHLRSNQGESEKSQKSSKGHSRGKDELWQQLLNDKRRATALGTPSAAADLAEIKVLESAGARRRRRYLNDRFLRDMNGPMSARDMAAQFNPVPFGTFHQSPLSQISQLPAVWSGFVNIDSDRQDRVLQKWAAHNEEAASSARPRGRSHVAESAESVALRRWSAVNKRARAALRRANVHSVLQLEQPLLDLVAAGQDDEQLVLPLEDGYVRLLVHGLADFHDLLSSSKHVGDETCVVVSHRAKRGTPSTNATSVSSVSGMSGNANLPDTSAAATALSTTTASSTQQGNNVTDITCTDVLCAAQLAGPEGLCHAGLRKYVQLHVHGYDVPVVTV